MSEKNRKAIPLARGCFDYFPDALAAVAEVSRVGNDKHNPGEPLHWSREKSNDHPDAMLRHFKERGGIDPENGLRHSAEMVWRGLAILQEELEAAGAPVARGAVLPSQVNIAEQGIVQGRGIGGQSAPQGHGLGGQAAPFDDLVGRAKGLK